MWRKWAWPVAIFYVVLLSLRNLNDYFDCRTQILLMHEYASHWVDHVEHREPLWRGLLIFSGCNGYFALPFLLSAAAYIGLTLAALRRLTPRNPLMALLLFAGSMFYFTYATHAVRNGLACSIMLTIISLVATAGLHRAAHWGAAGVLALIAVGIHTSVLLPLAALCAAIWIVKQFSTALIIWLAAIVLSLAAGHFGDPVSHLCAQLNIDYRFQYYAERFWLGGNQGTFRWDFLLYSALPVLFGLYVMVLRGISNPVYSLLLRTYLLANAGWVLFIHISISDRFAYLSWFMWPLLWAYPLLQMRICAPRRQFLLLSMVCLAQLAIHYL